LSFISASQRLQHDPAHEISTIKWNKIQTFAKILTTTYTVVQLQDSRMSFSFVDTDRHVENNNSFRYCGRH